MTLYFTLSLLMKKIKTRSTEIIQNAFYFENGKQRYKFIFLGPEWTYFVKHNTKVKSCYKENEVIIILEFLIDTILVAFGGHILQQIIGILFGTNRARSFTIFL